MSGLLEQIKNCNTCYYEKFTMEMLENSIREIFTSEPQPREFVWYAINRVTYSGRTLEEVRHNRLVALNNAKFIKTIQKFKPRIEFVYGKDNRRKTRHSSHKVLQCRQKTKKHLFKVSKKAIKRRW